METTMAVRWERGHWRETGKRRIQSAEEFSRARLLGRCHVYDLGEDLQEAPGKVTRMLNGMPGDSSSFSRGSMACDDGGEHQRGERGTRRMWVMSSAFGGDRRGVRTRAARACDS